MRARIGSRSSFVVAVAVLTCVVAFATAAYASYHIEYFDGLASNNTWKYSSVDDDIWGGYLLTGFGAATVTIQTRAYPGWFSASSTQSTELRHPGAPQDNSYSRCKWYFYNEDDPVQMECNYYH